VAFLKAIAARWRGAEREQGLYDCTWRKKEGPKRGPWHGGHSAGWSAAVHGRMACAAPLLGEQGRAAAVGDVATWVNVANERDRGEVGPDVSGGVQERVKRKEAGQQWGADTWA
jgi:hypothetical protein